LHSIVTIDRINAQRIWRKEKKMAAKKKVAKKAVKKTVKKAKKK